MRAGRWGRRRASALLVAATLGVVAGGCDAFFFDPGSPGPSRVAVAFQLADGPSMALAQDAFDRVDAARIELRQDGTLLFDEVVPLEVVAEGWAADIELEVDAAEGRADLQAELLDGGDPLFQGAAPITLRPGARSEVSLPTRLVDTPPEVTILAPGEGFAGVEGAPFSLRGQALDKPEGDLSNLIEWSSNRAGSLGTGSSVSVSLPQGSQTIRARVTDGSGRTGTASVSVEILPALRITTSSLPSAQVGVAYSATLSAVGGNGSYGWSTQSGTLPQGLNLRADGVITGTPTEAGTFTVTVRVVSAGAVASRSLTLTVSSVSPLRITTTSLPNGAAGASYSAALTATGGTGAYQWSVSGSLPAGLGLNPSSGGISGTPQAPGTSSFTVRVSSGGQSVSRAFSITITSQLRITTTSLPDGTVGAPYSATLSATGGTGAYAWSLASGALPNGLSLQPVSGAILGTPAGSGTFSFTVQVSSGSEIATAALSLTVVTTPASFFLDPNGVTVRCPGAAIGDSGTVNGTVYTKRSRAQLDALISSQNYAPLATTCTSGITDMSSLFSGANTFDEPIGSWDVSSVTTMSFMFSDANAFNQSLASWDVSSLTDMYGMFSSATAFNQPLDSWNVGSVTNMAFAFYSAGAFNQPLHSWNVSSVTDMRGMFWFAWAFDQPLDPWGVSSVTDMSNMFSFAGAFNQPLDSWDVSSVGTMSSMFESASAFNQPLDSWDVSSVTNMTTMFASASAFNQDLSQWCVTQIGLQPPGFDSGATSWTLPRPNWGTCPGSAPIFFLDTNGVTVRCPAAAIGDSGLVGGTLYTKRSRAQLDALISAVNYAPLATTCTSGITDMSLLFNGASTFNAPISSWDVSSVTDMGGMFSDASAFNQPLGSWDVSSVTDMAGMFVRATAFNQPLDTWDVRSVLDMFGMFIDASAFNQPLASWDVSSVAFMGYMFDGATSFNQPLATWNVGNVTSMEGMFANATFFDQPIGSWDVSNVTGLTNMFLNATRFNQPIGSWDVSSVVDMTSMFQGAGTFDQPLGSWNVSAVTDMRSMFRFASAFNQPIDSWDVSSVTDMHSMFQSAAAFNQPLGSWDVSSVNDMSYMFNSAGSFNQDLSQWCVPQISSMPIFFDSGAIFWTLPRPDWGTCPP